MAELRVRRSSQDELLEQHPFQIIRRGTTRNSEAIARSFDLSRYSHLKERTRELEREKERKRESTHQLASFVLFPSGYILFLSFHPKENGFRHFCQILFLKNSQELLH